MGRTNGNVEKLHEKKKQIEKAVRDARENQVSKTIKNLLVYYFYLKKNFNF